MLVGVAAESCLLLLEFVGRFQGCNIEDFGGTVVEEIGRED